MRRSRPGETASRVRPRRQGRHGATGARLPQPGAAALPTAYRCSCGGSCPRCRRGSVDGGSGLPISRPGDAFERQAERVARRVAAGAPPGETLRPGGAGIGRAARPTAPGGDGSAVRRVLSRPGRPLDRAPRRLMEARFGHDFADVRVHTSPLAAAAAESISARAFTVGGDIVFGEGRYAPGTSAGRALLAHELTHVVQQSAAGTPGVQRAMITDAHGVQHFEFVFGTDVTTKFATEAKSLTADGSMSDDDLRKLREQALKVRGTLNDIERMFMAGLLDAANVALLAAAATGTGGKVTFPVSTITAARYSKVIDLDRAAPSAAVTVPQAAIPKALLEGRIRDAFSNLAKAQEAAKKEILTHAGGFTRLARSLIAFADANTVPQYDVLAAMLAAASDNTPGDKVLAGLTYAVAKAAGNAAAADVKAGNIKVDALSPKAFAAVPGMGGYIAAYVTLAQASGVKGDTVYIQTDFDVNDLGHRSVVIHELQHALGDKAAAARPTLTARNQLELDGFRAQAKYILEQLAPMSAADRVTAGAQALRVASNPLRIALLIEGQAKLSTYEPILIDLFAADTPATPAATVKAALAKTTRVLITTALAAIDAGYKLAPGAVGTIDQLAGESQIH